MADAGFSISASYKHSLLAFDSDAYAHTAGVAVGIASSVRMASTTGVYRSEVPSIRADIRLAILLRVGDWSPIVLPVDGSVTLPPLKMQVIE